MPGISRALPSPLWLANLAKIICPLGQPRNTRSGPSALHPLVDPHNSPQKYGRGSNAAPTPLRISNGPVTIGVRSVPEHLYVHDVGADVGKPELLGSRLRQVEIPPINVGPTVIDLYHRGVAPVTHKQLRAER